MNISGLGYIQDLFILPFDHRSSFEAGLLGIRDRDATPHEVAGLAAYKRVIYEGFLLAVAKGGFPKTLPPFYSSRNTARTCWQMPKPGASQPALRWKRAAKQSSISNTAKISSCGSKTPRPPSPRC